MALPVLDVASVFKNYGPLQALGGVSFSVAPQEIHGLIGPNGSGKSTTLHCIAGLLAADRGEIRLDGAAITRSTVTERSDRGLSIKFQLTRVFTELTLFENVLLGLQRRDRLGQLLLSRTRRALSAEVMTILARVGLADRATDLAGNLSHGEQQWLEIAMALSVQPRLLLLDEPTAGMNAREREVTGTLIRQARESGCAILIVEHDIEFIARICDRITVLDEGEVIVDGTPDEIRRDCRVQAVFLGYD